mmetsp:Transcript_6708/g.10596  ORF Transcript_6708/g.10596 Transcript_6708/m.10596 type:complete len:697 (-) Transcript_6708:20-2110(-)
MVRKRQWFPPKGVELWEFAEYGRVDIVREKFDAKNGLETCFEAPQQTQSLEKEEKQDVQVSTSQNKSRLLGVWSATAIPGNDITSSILYTGGLVIGRAGFLAPFSFLIVVFVLYGFRSIYSEVVGAFPLNGGTYSALMNVSRKKYACFAAVLSVISYVATVVTSGASAMHYLQGIWPGLVMLAGVSLIMVFFCLLMLLGVKESGTVSLVIFLFHMFTLSLLFVISIVYAFHTDWRYLSGNFHAQLPNPPFTSLIFGYAQALLGISGYESAANCIEKMQAGVFKKTLFNMWAIVAFFNTTLCFLAFAVIPVDKMYSAPGVVSAPVSNMLLSVMASEMSGFVGGSWLNYLVVIDGVLVLCGAMFAGYVGSSGLLVRMVSDDCLPSILDARIKCSDVNYPVPILFCLVCLSLYLMAGGDVEAFGGVYVVAFLSVMFMFGASNLILKNTRKDIPRDTYAKWYIVLSCMFFVAFGLVINIIMNVKIVGYFLVYFVLFLFVILGMYARGILLRVLISLLGERAKESDFWSKFRGRLIHLLASVEKSPVIFFSRRLDIRDLNKAVRYVQENELTRYLIVVHAFKLESDIPSDIQSNLDVLKQEYPTIRIDLLAIQGKFSPELVSKTQKLTAVPPNRMFIASPSAELKYNIAELGGVRIIMRRHDKGLGDLLLRLEHCHKQIEVEIYGEEEEFESNRYNNLKTV